MGTKKVAATSRGALGSQWTQGPQTTEEAQVPSPALVCLGLPEFLYEFRENKPLPCHTPTELRPNTLPARWGRSRMSRDFEGCRQGPILASGCHMETVSSCSGLTPLAPRTALLPLTPVLCRHVLAQ